MAEQDLDIKIRTTADVSGIQQTKAALASLDADAKKAAEEQGKATRETGEAIGRLAGQVIGAASIYALVNNIKEVASQISQISKELEKQSTQLVTNSAKYQEQARSATTQADIIKIGESALKDVDAAQRRVIEGQQEELSLYNKITDSVYHVLAQVHAWGTASADSGRISKQALDLMREGQEQVRNIAEQNLVGAIHTGKAYEEAFERRKAEPLDEAIQKIITRIGDLQQLLSGIDYTKFPQSWLQTAKNIELSKSQLAGIVALQKEAQKAADIAAKPLAKALETPTGKFVEGQQRAEAEHEVQRAALEQKRREAVATGDTDRAKAIKEELTHDTFARDQRKEALQRYVANQESLLGGEGATQQNLLKQLGSLGATKYETAQRELGDIYGKEKKELHPGGISDKGSQDIVTAIRALADLWK